MKLEVTKNNIRIDSYITEETDYSRSKIAKGIKEGKILVNNKPVQASYKVKEKDLIEIEPLEEEVIDVIPEKMDLDIVYEDEYLAIINKKSGVVVHPAVGNYSHTLVNGLMYHFNTISKEKTTSPATSLNLALDSSFNLARLLPKSILFLLPPLILENNQIVAPINTTVGTTFI